MDIRQLFLEHVGQTSSAPMLFEPVRGKGVYLFDKDGKKFLDLISGIAVSALGHGRPEILDAIQSQSEKYIHAMVYGEYVISPQALFAKELSSHLPPNLQSVYFTNTGSEAVEAAMKLARKYTGRSEILSFKNAYHGSTQGPLSLMSNPFFSQAYRPLIPGINYLDLNSIEDLEKITNKSAAVFLETIQGAAGCLVPEYSFMQALREKCTETGTLLILDEIQTGMGRTGKLWAFEHYNIVPDVLLSAKALGGGMPLGAFISSKEILSCLTKNPILGHINTFGGHAVCCAAGLAHYKALIEGGYIQDISRKESLFRENLNHPKIEQISGKGLMLSVYLDSPESAERTWRKGLEVGILTDSFLFKPNAIRIAPPLVISDEEIVEACELLKICLDQ